MQNRSQVDTTKDRQERAIYAFTIVTVIFLPLSAVASIFGMNTRDFRDMELDQWVYWVTAIPVTTLVVLLGLWWTGELENVFVWLATRASRRRGYRPLPDDGFPPPGYPYPPQGYYPPQLSAMAGYGGYPYSAAPPVNPIPPPPPTPGF
jgi:hypothetical protein